jgi:DNA-binding transcriptional MerR regulator
MKKYFLTKEVAQVLGVTQRTLRFYLEEELVHPELGDLGRGKVRRYTRRDIILFSFIRELATHGLKIGKIKGILDLLKVHAFYSDPDANNPQDLENPNKEWIDFLDMRELEDDSIRVYVVISNFHKDPLPIFSIVEDERKSVILRVSDMMKCSSVLTIDVTHLFKKVAKL